MKSHDAHAGAAQCSPAAATADHAEAAPVAATMGAASGRHSAQQARVTQSPRMVAQRRQMQAVRGTPGARKADAQAGSAPRHARLSAVQLVKELETKAPGDMSPASGSAEARQAFLDKLREHEFFKGLSGLPDRYELTYDDGNSKLYGLASRSGSGYVVTIYKNAFKEMPILYSTIRHELIHVAQQYKSDSTNGGPGAGASSSSSANNSITEGSSTSSSSFISPASVASTTHQADAIRSDGVAAAGSSSVSDESMAADSFMSPESSTSSTPYSRNASGTTAAAASSSSVATHASLAAHTAATLSSSSSSAAVPSDVVIEDNGAREKWKEACVEIETHAWEIMASRHTGISDEFAKTRAVALENQMFSAKPTPKMRPETQKTIESAIALYEAAKDHYKNTLKLTWPGSKKKAEKRKKSPERPAAASSSSSSSSSSRKKKISKKTGGAGISINDADGDEKK